MSKIILYVPQGLGDIFWIYQKIVNHFDEIEFGICTIYDNEVEARSLEWMKLFPKCTKSYLHKVSGGNYNLLLNGEFNLANIIRRNKTNQSKPSFYSCNRSLEKSIRLENIDKEYTTQWNIPLLMKFLELDWKHYIVLYVSGTNTRWDVSTWVNLVKAIFDKYKTKYPVYVLGANFDSNTSNTLCEKLSENNIENKPFIGKSPEEVCFLLKNAEAFIGHQSGLNIIADNFDVKQLMMYHEYLRGLTLSWPKSSNIQQSIYNLSFFNASVEDILNQLPKDFLPSKHKLLF